MSLSRAKTWKVGSAALLAALMGVSSTATAQEAGGFDAQTFQPALSPSAVFSVDGSRTYEHRQIYGGLLFNWANDPLVMEYEDGSREAVIESQLAAHLSAGIGLFDRYQVELALPIYFSNSGDYQGQSFGGAGVGDLALRGKAHILSLADGRFGLGAGLDLSLPTGVQDAYLGSRTVTATPRVMADYRLDTPAGGLLLAANLGARLRGTDDVHDARIGPNLSYGVGAELEAIADVLFVGAELFGSAVLTEPARAKSPLEALIGVRWAATETWSLTLAGGGGLVGGLGSAAQRGLLGVSYRPAPTPDSGEVVPTEKIVCEFDAPPGYEGPRDAQGCPVVEEQGCASLTEDWQGAVDEDGCPILDQDGDGIPDSEDACPTEPQDFDGLGVANGCPQEDVDGDGILDVEDRCPTEPGLRLHEGCPPPVQKAVREGDEIRILDKVFFQTDKAVILEDSFELLDQVALIMRTNPDIMLIEVAGHTDRRGDADYNMMLSEERAKTVREYLINQGQVDASRVVARGYGQTELLIDEDTDEAHAANRRVEFRILEQGSDEAGSPEETEAPAEP
ncbi:OmpA family protein [Lujinxingia vulgaris]|nr:OmpA family protein [Lujinxingia vulgaris]